MTLQNQHAYMHRKFLATKFLGIFFLIVLLVVPLRSALALSGCSATITPAVAGAGNSATATFNFMNEDGLASMNWIHITRPSQSFWISGISDTTWSVAGDATQLYLSSGNLAPGQNFSVDISFNADVQDVNAQTWGIEASDSGDASAAVVCQGQHSTSISGHPANDSSNGITGVLAVADTNTSAVISWQSDYPTSSYVYYGTTSNYGQVSNYDATQVQDHSVTISGLTASTGYHFQVAGTDGSGSSVWSADNTFIAGLSSSSGGGSGGTGGTSGGSSSGGGSNQGTNQTGGGKTGGTIKLINTTPPPVVTIDTVLTGVYKTAPKINGTATGTVAISKIEYSIDNAKNWIDADATTGVGTLGATYSFTPLNLKDGNYFVIVRATDKSGNAASVDSKTFVIDLLPPIVGASVMNVGAQSILPNQQGAYSLVEDTDAMITLNAVGGPTSISLEAQQVGNSKTAYTFNMKRSADTGLWTGIASFTSPGTYTLEVHATDGAGNKTLRTMGSVVVQSSGRVADAAQKPLEAALYVYFLDPETNVMTLWDAGSSDQTNPVKTSPTGTYGLYLPAGTYYLKITAPGYETITSSIFKSSQPLNVASAIHMRKKPGLHIGKTTISAPWVSFKQTKLDISTSSASAAQHPKSQKLPVFSLSMTNEKKLSTVDLFAKPTVLTFITTWSDAGRDQLSLLSSVSSSEVNIIPVVSGESVARVRSYAAVAGYTTPVVIDNANKLAQDMGVSVVPTHYFVDRRGTVTKIMTGVMSQEELIKNATN